jgi:hypothetical protein
MTGSTLPAVAIVAMVLAQAPGPLPADTPADAPLERMTFVVEFADGRVTHHPVGPRRGSSWTPMFPRVPGWEPAPGDLHPAAVNFTFHRTDGGVRFTVSVLLGEPHEREVAVHEGTLHLGDRVTVNRLVEHGVRPIIVALEPLASVEFHEPAIVNHSSGLQIAAVKTIVDPAPRYVVTVENLTDRGADGFSFESTYGGRKGHSGVKANEDGRVLVPPRGTYTFDFPFPTGPGPKNAPWAPVPADELALTAVTWDDGSFEGSPRAAGVHRIRVMARRVQVQRVVHAVRRALAVAAIADAVSLLRQDVDNLSIEVDTTLEDAATALLPTAGAVPAAEVTGMIRWTLQRVKSQASGEVAGIERASRGPDVDKARQALQTMEQEFSTWLRQLQR